MSTDYFVKIRKVDFHFKEYLRHLDFILKLPRSKALQDKTKIRKGSICY